ncbi:B12-binding domain-containing protein [Plantactinospora sp. KBS50]|uniref:cobalamin B12-binding domain-containing protein n=1 Tax=Plantactinospora sp. KBS50 TaxID=2024580 RepID=UPI000BAB04B7|nr:cobalamin B12-binding domain-containing protein [Plantactinospora sp. KBS50]ASW54998.1 cobalamin-binding protein [Plantactinospora sp. KBS50]
MTRDPDGALAGAYAELIRCLADADEYAATDVALGLLAAGVPAERVLLDLVAPAQAQVGRWWQANEWSVAQEHAATHISERVVAAVSSYASPRPHRGRVVVACMDGEWHALPARLVAEVLRLRGWHVTFLGASVPAAHLVSYLHRHDAQAVALGCAVPMRLPQAHTMIEACRRADVPILVGGLGFGADGRWARRLGAAWAPDALAAADLVGDEEALDTPSDGASRLADDEYPGLVQRRGELIDGALAALRERVPATRDYTPAQLDRTVEDLGYILDFLAAAVYVDDVTLFDEFLDWLVQILTSRGVPAGSVGATLGHFAAELRDFPRARRFLTAGRRILVPAAGG